MTVFLRGSTWCIDCKFKKLRHRETVGPDREQAVQREAEVLLSLRMGRVPESKSAVGAARFSEAVAMAFKTKWSGPKGRKGVRNQCDRMTTFFKDKHVKDLSLKDVQALVSHLKVVRGISDPTIRRYLSALQVVLKVAYHSELCSNILNVTSIKGSLKESKGREKVFSSEQQAALLAGMYKRRHLYGVFTEALWATGARVGELLQLTWDCYHDGVLVFKASTTKSGYQKTLPVGPKFAELLDSLPRTSSLIFHGVNYWGYRSAWNYVRKTQKLDKDLVIHSVRHSVATRLVQKVKLPVAQRWLGHQQVATTMRYVHLGVADLQEASEFVDQFCGPNVDQTGKSQEIPVKPKHQENPVSY